MTEIFSGAIEVMLIIAALVVLFCIYKYPKEIFIEFKIYTLIGIAYY